MQLNPKPPTQYYLIDREPQITDRFGSIEADAVTVDGCVLVAIPDDLAYDESDTADLILLSAMQALNAKYPDRTIVTVDWCPVPPWPRTVAYMRNIGCKVAVPEHLEEWWDDMVRR